MPPPNTLPKPHMSTIQSTQYSPRDQRPSIVSSTGTMDSETTTTGEKWVSGKMHRVFKIHNFISLYHCNSFIK